MRKRKRYLWEVHRISGLSAPFIGSVWAVDENQALKTAIKQHNIRRADQWRLLLLRAWMEPTQHLTQKQVKSKAAGRLPTPSEMEEISTDALLRGLEEALKEWEKREKREKKKE
jgi:hypothetical protein